MIPELIQNIVDYSHLENQLKICQIDKPIYQYIHIYKLRLPGNMKQNIFMQDKYSRVRDLDCRKNDHIHSLDHLGKILIKLNCSYITYFNFLGESAIKQTCGITQKSIDNLHVLEELDCTHNHKIYYIDHLNKSLKMLHCEPFKKIIKKVYDEPHDMYYYPLSDAATCIKKINEHVQCNKHSQLCLLSATCINNFDDTNILKYLQTK